MTVKLYTPGDTVTAAEVQIGDTIYIGHLRSTREPAEPATVIRKRIATGPYSAGLVLLGVQRANHRQHITSLRPSSATRQFVRAVPIP